MMDFWELLQIIATLFFLLCIGYLCRRIGIVDDGSSRKFSRLIIEIGQPAMIVSALINASYSEAHIRLGLTVMVLGFLLHAFFAVIAYFAAKPVKEENDRKLTEFSLLFANAGFIGFPIMEAVFGADGRFMGAFYVVSFNILVWTWGIVILGRGRKDIRLTPKRALLNFGTIPCAIGIGLFFSNLPLPGFVYTTSQYLSNLCTPISVIITGSLIATRPLKDLLCSVKLYYQSFIKLVALPVLTALVAKLVLLFLPVEAPEMWILFSTLVAALPSAATVTMLAERYEVPHAEYASQSVGLSSVLSLATLPLALWFAQWIAGI